jgi:cell division septation protein DedD
MLGLLDKTPETDTATAEPAGNPATPEFEMVVGRRQVASWLFLMILLVGVASTLAFLAGKMTAPASARTADVPAVQKPVPQAPAQTQPQTGGPAAQAADAPKLTTTLNTSLNAAAPAVSTPLPQATILNAPFAAMKKPASGPELPLFQEPKPGAVYLQMGALDRGMAMILTEGLRKHGFDASVAPGPSEKIFRVLIGPLPDPQAFARAKAEVDALELGTFARKYQQ